MLLGTLACWPFLTGFIYPPLFDLSWDEEVQLHDGRAIVVHLKFTYERLSRFSKYGNSILRNTEMSFDAGPPHGRVTQLFRRQQPVMLDQSNGQWYVVLAERGNINVIRDEDWGPVQAGAGLRVGLLARGRFTPISISLLPEEFNSPNLDYHYGPFEEKVALNGHQLSIGDKKLRAQIHPLAPVHRMFIYRPPPLPEQSQQFKGEKKD